MIELLFLVALAAWLAISALQYMAGLPAAGTLFVAAIMVPCWLAHMPALARSGCLGFIHGTRRPVPPERFYWPIVRRGLGWRTAVCSSLAAAAWLAALTHPALLDPATIPGWLSGAAAIVMTAEASAAAWLYVKASQRFNHLKPGVLGWIRLSLYRLSDNHEFLGDEPLPRQKMERVAVY